MLSNTLAPWQYTDATRPDYARPEHNAALPDMTLVRDLLAGTRSMQARGPLYVPKWPDEDSEVHRMRYMGEPLFGAFSRILDASVGKMFATPPAIEWGARETELRAHWDNIDAKGTKGEVGIRWFSRDALADGLALILVDHPRAPEGEAVTLESQSRLNLRPIWAFYTRQHILSWRTEVVDNVEVMRTITLYEPAREDFGSYGVQQVHRYRVLELTGAGASYTVWKKSLDEGQKEIFVREAEGIFRDARGNPLRALPISIAYTGPHPDILDVIPPLMPVAHANLAHWRTSCELTFGRSWSAIEQLVVIGELARGPDGKPLKVRKGWTEAIQVQVGGDVKHVGPSGAALDQLVKGKTEKEQEMAALGLAFLTRETRSAETAESKRIDSAAQDATLATSAQGIEDAINMAWEHHLAYLGGTKADAPVVTINRDYEQTAMDAPTMAAYVTAVRDAGIPVRLLLEAWQQGGRIPAGADLDALEGESVAGLSVQVQGTE